jgi:hypothetical protein
LSFNEKEVELKKKLLDKISAADFFSAGKIKIDKHLYC